MKKLVAAVATALSLVGLSLIAAPAMAIPPSLTMDQVLCHATGSASNPYTLVPINKKSAHVDPKKHSDDIIPANAECFAAGTHATDDPSDTGLITANPVAPYYIFDGCGKAGTLHLTPVEGVRYEQELNSDMAYTYWIAYPLEGYQLIYADLEVEPSVRFMVRYVPDNCPPVSTTPTPTPKPTTVPTPPATAPTPKPTPSPVSHKNCDQLGRVNIPRTDPAYDPFNDRNHNGIACEKNQPVKSVPTQGTVKTSPTPKPTGLAPVAVKAPTTPKATTTTPPAVQPNRGVNIDTGASTTVTASTEKLATTGADNTGLAVLGVLMLLLGLILLVPKAFSTRNH